MSLSIHAAFMPTQQDIDAVTAIATTLRGVNRNKSRCASRHNAASSVAAPRQLSIQAASIASQQTEPTVSATIIRAAAVMLSTAGAGND